MVLGKLSVPGCATNLGGDRMVRRCWVNFQFWGVLLIWIGPIALAVGAGGVVWTFFSGLFFFFSFFLCRRRSDLD